MAVTRKPRKASKRGSGKQAARRPTARRTAAARGPHSKRFPGESAAYRAARNQLLAAEAKLRDQIEAVAALRRKLPAGGVVAKDYAFEELGPDGMPRRVRLSELFAPGKDTLIVYNFMYGPAMRQACTSCTSILDGLDGETSHVTQRVNLAIVAKSPIQRVVDFARGRGWRQLRLLSSAGNDYNATYFGETEDGSQMPMLNVFVRKGSKIHHTYGTELLYTPTRPGQDGRHVDMIWPLWNLLDLTPEGRGTSWYPRLSY